MHGDFHRGNMRFTEDGWHIYDWTDGCLSLPLIDLAPAARGPEAREARIMATHRLWQEAFPQLTEEQTRLGLVAGMAHQVATYQRIADGVEPGASEMWAGEGVACTERLLELLVPS